MKQDQVPTKDITDATVDDDVINDYTVDVDVIIFGDSRVTREDVHDAIGRHLGSKYT